ncbi:deoxyribodipyrimidine photolyase [Halorubrum trapanicum]|uniref:Deoxyribodipyrimidine photolyase n=1 Tax=Halorubrum trapanicum TaxID=29284 RepID=A0A8J7UN01_9EURY|nr:deoxyribodipyrimidine photolyase [Halorubrum trapanicum]
MELFWHRGDARTRDNAGLADVPAEKVVDWPTLSRAEREGLAPDYPHPIVDRNEGYERAQRVFEEALGKR